MQAPQLLAQKWESRLRRLISSARNDLLICSPYFGTAGAEFLKTSVNAGLRHSGKVRFLTDLSPLNIYQMSTDPAALLSAVDAVGPAAIYHLPRLHAKVYVADSSSAIVTSGNFTAGGLYRNLEYGIEVHDVSVVHAIRDDLTAYSELGAVIPRESLMRLCEHSDRLRASERRARVSVPTPLKRELDRCLRETEDELLRLRLSGGALHTVFARTIEYLLSRNGPLPTNRLHPLVAAVHPDLCDDSVDRVIGGVRFGKKWKHAVRTAQQRLKRQGVIELDGDAWRLTTNREDP